ncbi:ANKRD17 [Symbiodinium sp. CCMP2592]|nr:ANKRD17 [Symbiodinium sp. CCMP2592]
MVDQPYEQVVSSFLGRFLDMDSGEIAGKVGIIRVDYEKEFCQPSETYPGITNIFAFFSVFFNLNMPLPLNFGRPIVRTQKAPAENRVEELWSWRRSQLCGNPIRSIPPDLSGLETHERQEDIYQMLEQALRLNEEGERAILRCLHCPYDSGRPVVLVVAVYRETLKTTQLVVAKVLWDVTDDEVSEQSRAGEELRRTLTTVNRVASGPRNHLATQIGGSSNYFFDLSKHVALVALELPLACTEPPEVLSAALGQQLEVPFVLLRDIVLAAATGRSDMTLAATLAPTLESLMASLVAPGSVLGRLMSSPQRASIDIVEAYKLDTLGSIMESTDPRFTKYNIFHKATGTLIAELCKTVGIEDDFRNQLTEKLHAIKALCNRLEKKSWGKDAWRPLCCMAHGNLTTRSVIVDALGSTWLYDWGTHSTTISWQGHGKSGGQQPLFRDLARLSARILFEGCRLPLSLQQAQQICAASWVDLTDLSRWFSIPKSVAYLFQRKMLESDFSKDSASLASKAQASRRVSKMLEQAAAGPAPLAAESLQGRLVGRDVDVRRAFREAQCLGRAIMALPLLGLPEGLNAARSMHSEASQSEGEVDTVGDPNGPRGLAWKQQKALHTAAQASRQLALERFLGDPMWVQKMVYPDVVPKNTVSLLPVDTSPLLLGLPLLEEVLALVVGTSLDPWQKAWACSFAADLATKLLPHLQGLLGRETLPRTLSFDLEGEAKEDQGLIGMDVRFAKGHRLSATGEPKVCSDLAWCFGSRQRSTDGTFAFRRECQLTPEFLEKALLGWPCPVAGVPNAAVTEHRHRLGALPAGENDWQKDEDCLEAVRAARRKNLWRKAAGALYEVEAISLKPVKRLNTQRRIANQGSVPLALHQVTDSLTLSSTPEDVQELKVLGQRLGTVAYAANAVQCCPHSSEHSDSAWAPLASEYDTFPCTLCRQKVSAACPQEAYFAHCAECWLEQKRFTLCRECSTAEPPCCPHGHTTTKTEISPYDRTPSCRRCRKVVGNLGAAAPPGEPHWFHCPTCRTASKKSPDLCRGCAVLYCAAGHELEWIASFKGLKSVCQSCGSSGHLKVYHCSECQEARVEVMYPTGLAAKSDVKLGGRAGDVKVMAVAPGGAAATAGVVAGHRLLSVNDHPPAVASGAIFDGVKDQAVLLEFITVASFDITLESAKALQESIVMETRHYAPPKGPFIYVTEVRSRTVQQDHNIDRGFRLLSVNGIEGLCLSTKYT